MGENDLCLPLHATHITFLLSVMSDFAPCNEVYKSYFGTSPPSRATISVPLPIGQRVRIEVIGFDDRPSHRDERSIGDRQALHVQSLSYWAPANIGPYSQAVVVCPDSNTVPIVNLIYAIGKRTCPPRRPNPAPPSDPHPSSLTITTCFSLLPSGGPRSTTCPEDHRRPAESKHDWRRMVRLG